MYILLLLSAFIAYMLFKGIIEYRQLKKAKKLKAIITDIHLFDGKKEISQKIASRPLKTSGMDINFIRRNDWLKMIIDYEYKYKGITYKDQGTMSVLPESTLLRLKPGNKILIYFWKDGNIHQTKMHISDSRPTLLKLSFLLILLSIILTVIYMMR